MIIFESFYQAYNTWLWCAFGIAFVMGGVINKTNFCTMGAVSDWVNIGDTNRWRAWMLAIAVAVLGVAMLEPLGLVMPANAFPPYRSSELMWAQNILGGVMFGVGMTLASGCGSKNLVRFGAGNLKSLVVLLCLGVSAYFMLNPFPGSDQTLMSVLFYHWMQPLTISLSSAQDVGSLLSTGEGMIMRLVLGSVIAFALLMYIFRSSEYRSQFDHIVSGVVIGLAVVGAWYVTSNLALVQDEEQYSLYDYRQQWDFLVGESDTTADRPPVDTRSLSPQSYTFINPVGQTIRHLANGLDYTTLTFGVMAVLGMISGSFFWALVKQSFRIEWFASIKDFINHVIGGILMGLGGTLALGCTIGQGVSGISTLSLGSFIALGAIVFSCALTLKIQLYKIAYDGVSLYSAFVTALVDMRIFPSSWRRYDAL